MPFLFPQEKINEERREIYEEAFKFIILICLIKRGMKPFPSFVFLDCDKQSLNCFYFPIPPTKYHIYWQGLKMDF